MAETGERTGQGRRWWWHRAKHRPRPRSLREGGERECPEIRKAHDIVAAHAPWHTARLRELYLKSQYLLVPVIASPCCRCIEDDLRAAQAMFDEVGDGDKPEDRLTDKAALDLLDDRVRRAEGYIEEQGQTRAMRHYARGLARATVVVVTLQTAVAILARILLGASPVYTALFDTVVAVSGGAAGAAVSVLLRQSDSIGYIDDQSLVRAAFIRVVLGCIFAAAVVFLVRGHIVAIFSVPVADDRGITQWFFWGGLGFLAGFNERWVRHLITRDPEEKKHTDKDTTDAAEPPQDGTRREWTSARTNGA
jgi:hypothetical protein